ncbi:MAG: VWD domain-containing protein, partial [Pseudomonadota bacterium]
MYNFTQEEIAELEALAAGPSLRPFSDVYARIAELLETPDADGDAAPLAVRAWFIGARDVNRGVGPFSDFIRAYTQAQIEIRLGGSIENADGLLDNASDAIGRAVLDDILNSGALPSLNDIGTFDAGATIANIANNTGLPADTAIWSGNLLFVGLGDPSFFNSALIGNPNDTYDLLVAAQAAVQATTQVEIFDDFRNLSLVFDGPVLAQAFAPLSALAAAGDAANFLGNAYAIPIADIENLFGDLILDRVGAIASTLKGSAQSEILHGEGGNDTLMGGGGGDVLDGGGGTDTADLSDAGGGILEFANSADAPARKIGSYYYGGSNTEEALFDIENIVLGTAIDTLDGADLDEALDLDVINGDLTITGLDIVVGTRFDDIIRGGDQAETLEGGDGDDIFEGRGGDDFIRGDAQVDVAYYSGECSEYEITRSGSVITIDHVDPAGEANDGTDTLTNVERAVFANGFELDLMAPELRCPTVITAQSNFFSGPLDGRRVEVVLEREGDLSYDVPLTVSVDLIEPNNGEQGPFDIPFSNPGDPSTDTHSYPLNPGNDLNEDAIAIISYRLDPDFADEFGDLVTIDASDITLLWDGDDDGGSAWGDPHLVTFDNVSYDFQAGGDFILARATEGPDYEVQTRFEKVSSAISVTKAAATRVSGVVVSIEVDGSADGTLLIDGVETVLASGSSIALGPAGSISRSGSRYDIDYGNGDSTRIDVFTSLLNVYANPDAARPSGSLEGLLGDDDGRGSNDFRLSDGTVLNVPLNLATLYGAFAESWMIDPGASLLPGGTADFSAPDRVVTVDSLPAALRAEAEAAVDAAGITNEIVREAAILDFALSGNPEFIQAAQAVEQELDVGLQTAPMDEVTKPAVVLVSDRTSLSEDGGQASFTVARGDTVGALTVRYTIVGAGAAPASAADLAGSVATGTVTIEDGQEEAVFNLAAFDDAIDEPREAFDVVLSLEDRTEDYELVVASVRLSIEDNDEPPAASLEI